MAFENRMIGVFCCVHVLRRERPVLLVTLEGGDWQFMCGGLNHDVSEGRYVHLKHLLDFDPSLDELADLPAEWEAERLDPNSPWFRTMRAAGSA
jgi:hypothetical protein